MAFEFIVSIKYVEEVSEDNPEMWTPQQDIICSTSQPPPINLSGRKYRSSLQEWIGARLDVTNKSNPSKQILSAAITSTLDRSTSVGVDRYRDPSVQGFSLFHDISEGSSPVCGHPDDSQRRDIAKTAESNGHQGDKGVGHTVSFEAASLAGSAPWDLDARRQCNVQRHSIL